MYKRLIRPLLFLIPPETVHHLIVGIIKFGSRFLALNPFLKATFSYHNPVLEREVMGLKFKNPVGLAAGFDKNADFYSEFAAFGFSHIEIGTVTPKPQPGNAKPRSFRLKSDKALINRMGFNNKGVDYAVEKLKVRKNNIIIGGNIGKNTATPNENAVDDYVYNCKSIYDSVDYLVINVSCPNVTNLHKLQDQDSLNSILGAIAEIRGSKALYKPVLLKLSPDLNTFQIDESLSMVNKHGIDGVIVSNTTTTRKNLKTSDQKIEQIGNGGLSGAPIKDRSTEMIRYIAQKTDGKLTIIGVGGILSPTDAIEKLNAGASLIQVYTGFIYSGPAIVKRINKAIAKSLQK